METFVERFPHLVLYVFGGLLLALTPILFWCLLERTGALDRLSAATHGLSTRPRLEQMLVLVLLAGVIVYGSTKDGDNSASRGRLGALRVRHCRIFPSLRYGAFRLRVRPMAEAPSTPVVTAADVARGWRESGSDAGGPVEMPAGVVTNDLLHRRGGHDWAFRVEPDSWRSAWKGGVLTGVTVFARGEVRPDVGTLYFPVPLTNGVSLLPEARWGMLSHAEEGSVFSHAVTTNGSLLLDWRNALVGRDPDTPTNLQMEIFSDGGFVWRTDGGSTSYLPVLPFDWDGDGLENSVDPDPLAPNPVDAHGTSAEWCRIVCSNVFESDGGDLGWKEGVNINAYYFVDVVASQGPAPIWFNVDRDSRLGSPVVVARSSETNSVPLLIGVEYSVTSTVPISVSTPMDSFAVVTSNDARSVTVKWPLEFTVTTSVDGHTVTVTPVPYDPGGIFEWDPVGDSTGGARLMSASSSACSYIANGGCVSWGCGADSCGCRGCSISGSYTLEEAILNLSTVWCGCWEDDPEEPEPTPEPHSDMASKPSVTATFSEPVVLFEDAYTNAPGEVVQRQSTTTTLTISAYGGANGAYLQVDPGILETKLVRTDGHSLPTARVRIPENSDVTYEISYEGKAASSGMRDIEVTATLTAINDMSPSPSIANLTAVRVAINPEHKTGEMFRSRHKFGVCERVFCESWPSDIRVRWDGGALGTTRSEAARYLHEVPFAALAYNLVASAEGVSFRCPVESIFPDAVKAFNDDSHSVTMSYSAENASEAGWVGVELPVYCSPTNVYFGEIQVRELETEGVVTEYFASSAWTGGRDHHGDALSDDWLVPTEDANYFGDDMVSISGCSPPWGWGGTLTWYIPNVCRAVVDGEFREHVYSQSIQRFSITSNGVVEITKFGYHVRRSPGQGQLPVVWRNDEN